MESTDESREQAALLVSAAITRVSKMHDMSVDVGRALPEMRAILEAPEQIWRHCVVLTATATAAGPGSVVGQNAIRVLSYIAGTRTGLSLEDIAAALPLEVPSWPYSTEAERLTTLVRQVEATWKNLDEGDRVRLLPRLGRLAAQAGGSQAANRLRKLVATSDRVPYELIDGTDEVGKALQTVIAGCPVSDHARRALVQLLSAYPTKGKPVAAWLEEVRRLPGRFDKPGLLVGALLDAAIAAPDYTIPLPASRPAIRYVTGGNEAILCGLAVLAGLVAGSDPAGVALLPRLRALALKAIVMVGGQYGSPRSIRLANHCVQAIADAALPASVTELLRVERATRHGTLLRQVRQAVDALAAAQGMRRHELLERAVEDHGLDPDGTRRVKLANGWTAVLEAGPLSAQLAYLGPDAKPRKSVPPAVKASSAEALAGLQKNVKAVRATTGNERARLDRLLLQDRSWPVATWRELYLDHPVTGQLARALIWQFTARDGAAVTGIPVGKSALLTSSGSEAPIPAQAVARLWHPVGVDAGEARVWRQLLLDQQLAQPVKQAFREVYVLTPAEAETRDYTNRFAGHVFRQEQARALMKGRGWTVVPMAAWDDGIYHGVGRREYERARLRAEFFFDPADDHDIAHTGLYTYCVSDQVRFFDSDTGDPVSLAEVPPLVFSEAMRDVDLVIGVTSIGADPEWVDQGQGRRFEEQRFGAYWQQYAFGDLTVSGEVRREVLAQLLPKLAIADQCTLESRYLVVRGDLRTYRIHVGSGNVLMSPNDQYLCIVAARSAAAGKLFLPFDDDPRLSMILSKAFLLAADSKITDPSITRQIERG